MWCNSKFEGVLFRRDSRHNDRAVSLWQWLSGIETELLGILWLLAQVSGLITELAHDLICSKSGTVLNNDSYEKLQLWMIKSRLIMCIW